MPLIVPKLGFLKDMVLLLGVASGFGRGGRDKLIISIKQSSMDSIFYANGVRVILGDWLTFIKFGNEVANYEMLRHEKMIITYASLPFSYSASVEIDSFLAQIVHHRSSIIPLALM